MRLATVGAPQAAPQRPSPHWARGVPLGGMPFLQVGCCGKCYNHRQDPHRGGPCRCTGKAAARGSRGLLAWQLGEWVGQQITITFEQPIFIFEKPQKIYTRYQELLRASLETIYMCSQIFTFWTFISIETWKRIREPCMQ